MRMNTFVLAALALIPLLPVAAKAEDAPKVSDSEKIDSILVLDGIGGFRTYGQLDNTDTVLAERLLPMGLAEGSRLRRPVAQDQVLTYDDVELPEGRLSDRLRAEQDAMFSRDSAAHPLNFSPTA